MTPLEAWSVISGNLAQLYKMLKTPCFKGYVPADTEAEVIAFKALQEMQERQCAKELTLNELLQMPGEPVFLEYKIDSHIFTGWNVFDSTRTTKHGDFLEMKGGRIYSVVGLEMARFITGQEFQLREYGKTWHTHKYKPEEVKNV